MEESAGTPLEVAAVDLLRKKGAGEWGEEWVGGAVPIKCFVGYWIDSGGRSNQIKYGRL